MSRSAETHLHGNDVGRSVSAALRLQWLARLRLGVLVGTALLIVLAARRIAGLTTILLIVGLVAIANLAMLLYLQRTEVGRVSDRLWSVLVHGPIIVDLVGLTLCLHFGGGAENPFFLFFVFPVILAAILTSRRNAYLYASAAGVLYCGMLAAERFGRLSHYHLAGFGNPELYQSDAMLAAQGLAVTVTCLLTAGIIAMLVGALRARARELSENQRRWESQTAEMRALNEQLATANQELGHRRAHLDAAYAELQRAYDRLQVRSSHMSELNEQLRLANAECKHRREELSELNTKLAEAYRRQETRTEHMRDLNEQLRAANEECRAKREELEQVNIRLATANAKLRELEDVRAQFTLLVTHELRAPVAAIQSYLKLILEGYVPQAKVRETLEKAEKRAMEQLALIADLLELGRIGSADARGHVQPVQIEKLLKEQADLLASGARERNIKINLDIGADLPPVLTNPDQMKSLWNNLVSNAIKYNRDGGRVDVSVKQEGDRLVASVSDTGIGIPPEAMTRLFSEFFRADNAKVHSRMGTGLGLSIVKEIVERSGGQITAESELDKGTTFRFWLPVMKQDAG